MNPITVRATTEDDWLRLKDIRLAALRDSPTAFATSYAATAARDESSWRNHAREETQPNFWFALNGPQVIGMIGAAAGKEGECNLIAMWVHPDFRGTGAAGRLVDTVKTFAHAHGFRRVILCVAPENLPAVRLYSRHGFEFQNEWESMDSFPEIRVQKMSCPLEQS